MEDPQDLPVALRRLQQADPAAHAQPDLDAIAARLRQRLQAENLPGTPLPQTTPPAANPADTVAPVLPLPTAESRKRTPRLQMFAVAAAAVLVVPVTVGGGYLWGLSTAAAQNDALPALERTSPGASDQSVSGAEIAPATPSPAGRVSYRAEGLSAQASSAHVWAWDAQAGVDDATVNALIEALQIDGELRANADGWEAVDNRTGSQLVVGADGAVWYESGNLCAGGTAAPEHGPADSPADGSDGSWGGYEGCGDAPTAIQATGLAEEALTAAGVLVAGYTVEVQGGRGYTQVSVRPMLGAMLCEPWQLTYTSAGLATMSGRFAPTVDLGSYPVISPAAAVTRLTDTRFSTSTGAEATTAAIIPNAIPVPEPSAALGWALDEVVVNAAELRLVSYTMSDGAVVLAPTYVLTDTNGQKYEVIALTDTVLGLA